MRNVLRMLGAALLTLAPISTFAASTIDPNTPAQNAALNSAPLRANFQAAYNDINNLLSMYYGPTAPLSPSNLQSWANSSGFPVIVLSYYNSARATWIPYAQINVTSNTYQSFVGAGVAATPPIALSYPGNVATFALNYGADFTLSGNALTLAPENSSPGTYGDATHVAQVTVDGKGRTTAAQSVVITHAANDLVAANNLSDLANAATARTNLGLGNLAPANAGTGLAVDGSKSLNLQAGTATVIGGVEASPPTAHQFLTGITGGVASAAQPQASDVAGLGALATANAGTGLAISSGAANLQPAQPATIGGVESDASTAHQWVAYIDSSGVPHQTQPQLSDIGGLTNGVTNADLVQSGAATFKGNPSAAAANVQDFTIQGLTNNVSPDMVNDLIPIYNHATGAIQNVSASQLFGSVGNVTGVSNSDGSMAVAPTTGNVVVSLSAARKTLPTVSIATTTSHIGGFSASGSGTYTTPANVLWIDVTIIGGGGGGGAGNNNTAGGSGGASCWSTSGSACTSPAYEAGGGAGGTANNAVGGAGGSVSGSSPCNVLSVGGGYGFSGIYWPAGGNYTAGGAGGSGTLGGAGGNIVTAGGFNAAANTGGGGGGGGTQPVGGSTTDDSGGGGGSGATCRTIISSPAATYTFAVGAAGSGAAATATGGAGGNGAGGQIIVIEHYGS